MIQQAAFTSGAREFLTTHAIGVLSTLGGDGDIQSRAVYYVSDELGVYILTKAGTEKVHDILARDKLAFVVYDENTYQTIQIQGTGEVVGGQAKKAEVYRSITELRDAKGNQRILPVTSFHEGGFIVLHVIPTMVKFTDFPQKLESQA